MCIIQEMAQKDHNPTPAALIQADSVNNVRVLVNDRVSVWLDVEKTS